MAEGRFRAGVQPGDGVVARYADLAVVVAPGSEAFTQAVLRMVATSHDDPPSVLWRAAGLVVAHQPDVPAFALAIAGPERCRVLVHGAGRAVVGGEVVAAADLWTWAERAFGAPGSVALTVAPGPVVAAPHSDLRDGVLAGAGLLLEPEPVAAPRPAPTPAGRTAIVAPRPPTTTEVDTAMRALHQTVHLADTIAALVAADGTRVPLDRDYVFGRDPRQDPAVVRGIASPVKIDDGEQLISRVHAYLAVAPGIVTVRDCGSANGSYLAAPGAAGWSRIGPDPVPVPVGHSLRFGLRIYTHVPAEGAR